MAKRQGSSKSSKALRICQNGLVRLALIVCITEGLKRVTTGGNNGTKMRCGADDKEKTQ